MKTYKNNRFNIINLLMVLCLFGSLSLSCKGACVTEWTACANRCPTEEEGEEAADACFKRCPDNDFTCQVACQRKTREACLGQCGKKLQRCLGEGQ